MTGLGLAFARAAQKQILDIFKEICKSYNFGLPIFKQQKPLSNTKKKSAYEFNNKKIRYFR
jgi:hypothetical protein